MGKKKLSNHRHHPTRNRLAFTSLQRKKVFSVFSSCANFISYEAHSRTERTPIDTDSIVGAASIFIRF